MKTLLAIVIIGILLFSGFGAVVIHETEKNTLVASTTSIENSLEENDSNMISPKISTDNEFLDSVMELLMNYCHFPSVSTCIIKGDRVVWSNSYGFGDIENGYAATINTVYNIGSITKTITGTALMQLYDQGLFELDDDVNKYLPFNLRNPHFPDDPITIRMLLSHSSSLQEILAYWNINLFDYNGPPFDGYPMPWLEEYLVPGGSRYNPDLWSAEYRPGEQAEYANINFDLVAYLVELLSNQPFYEYCEEYIFIPLEMKNISFHIYDFSDEQLAVPYVWDSSEGELERNVHLVYLHYPVGGVFTTVLDLSHFMIAHMNGGVYNGVRILEEGTIEEMHKIQIKMLGGDYCLAWKTFPRYVCVGSDYPNYLIIPFLRNIYSGHGGSATYGVSTYMHMRLSGDTAVIIFVNNNAHFYKKGYNGFQLLQEVLFLKANYL